MLLVRPLERRARYFQGCRCVAAAAMDLLSLHSFGLIFERETLKSDFWNLGDEPANIGAVAYPTPGVSSALGISQIRLIIARVTGFPC